MCLSKDAKKKERGKKRVRVVESGDCRVEQESCCWVMSARMEGPPAQATLGRTLV